jgi:hypothetical protein
MVKCDSKPDLPPPEKQERMAPSKLAIVLAAALLCSPLLHAQEQSLGDIVKAQKAAKAKTSGGKLVDEESLADLRARNHVGGPGTECDPACEAAVRAAMEEKGKKMTDAEWAQGLADGHSDLESDTEWQEIFPGIQREVCMGETERAHDSERLQEFDRKLARKVMQEARDALQQLAQVTDPNASQEARERGVREIRAKAVKLQIMKYDAERAKQDCAAH